MKIKVNKKVVAGSCIVAIAFSESLKNMTSWIFPFIILALIVIMYTLNIMNGYKVTTGGQIFKNYFKYAMLPYLIIFVYSCILLIANDSDSKFMYRNIGSCSIAIMVVITSASLLYLYQEKAADILCYGLILNYISHIIIGFSQIGISGVIQHIKDPLNMYISLFEQHSTGFTLNLLLIYYLMKSSKKNTGKIVGILIAEYFIMKRVAFVGLFFAFIVWFIVDVILKKIKRKKYYIVFWALFTVAFLYVALISIYPDIYKLIMLKLGILNRYLFTASFFDYFSFDIRYMGKGYGFVSIVMPGMDIAGVSVLALHNDVLKDYIEVGFTGFIILYHYLFVGCPKMLFKNKDNKIIACALVIMCYVLMTLLIDNVLEYVDFTCALFTIFGILYFYGKESINDRS